MTSLKNYIKPATLERGQFYFMSSQEIINLLQQNQYIIKHHLTLCSESEKALPLEVYAKNIKALNELTPTEQEKQDFKLLHIEDNETFKPTPTAKSLLLEYGILYETQLNHYKNRPFLNKCDEFISVAGIETYKEVLARVNHAKENGSKINNVYGYIDKALNKELKDKGLN